MAGFYNEFDEDNSSGGGVTSLNGLTGAVILAAGTNITLTPVGNTITISATGGSSSLTATQVGFGSGANTLTGSANFTYEEGKTGLGNLQLVLISTISGGGVSIGDAGFGNYQGIWFGAPFGNRNAAEAVILSNGFSGSTIFQSGDFKFYSSVAAGYISEIANTGAMKFNKYGVGTFTGTATYALQVDVNGNIIEGTLGGSAGLTATQVGFGSGANLLTGSPTFTWVNGLFLKPANTAGATLEIHNIGNGVATNVSLINLYSAITTNPDYLTSYFYTTMDSTSATDGRLSFGIENLAETFTIKHLKVGIGTITPAELLSLGNTGTLRGIMSFAGNTSGKVTLQPAAAAGTWTMTLPTTGGTNGFFLQTNGSGVTTWAATSTSAALTATYVGYGDGSNLLTGTANFTFTNTTSLLTILNAGIGATPTASELLTNTTAAAAGAQQYSPATQWSGRGWKTTATAASQAVDWRMYVVPVQGTTAPSSMLTLDSSINGGAFTSRVTFNSDGKVGFSASSYVGILTIGTAGSFAGSLSLAGATSGTATINVASVAGTPLLTLPTTTDTLVGKATTDIFTNKTMVATTNVLGGVTMTLGSDATGDIYYRNSSGFLARLAIGSTSDVLTVTAGLPSWAAASGGGLTVGATTVAGGSTGNIFYNNAGVLGEMTTTGTGTTAVLSAGPTMSGTVTINGLTISDNGFSQTSISGFYLLLKTSGSPTITIGGGSMDMGGNYLESMDRIAINSNATTTSRFHMAGMPTSNAGLASGDAYLSSAATILANGDYVMGVKL